MTTRARVRFEVPDWSLRRGLVGSSSERPAPKAIAVLVIDGDPGHWNPVADVLRAAGYTVVQAHPGQDANRMVEHLRFAAIVVDAGISGFEQDNVGDITEDPPRVVVLSAVEDDETVGVTGRRAVARLQKPVSPYELVGALARAAGLHPR